MSHSELKEYLEKMATESDAAHQGLMDIALYSDGAASYAEILHMPTNRVKQLRERIERKHGGKGSDNKMKPGEVSQTPNAPPLYAETR